MRSLTLSIQVKDTGSYWQLRSSHNGNQALAPQNELQIKRFIFYSSLWTLSRSCHVCPASTQQSRKLWARYLSLTAAEAGFRNSHSLKSHIIGWICSSTLEPYNYGRRSSDSLILSNVKNITASQAKISLIPNGLLIACLWLVLVGCGHNSSGHTERCSSPKRCKEPYLTWLYLTAT